MHRHITGIVGILCVAAANPSSGQTAMEAHERFLCTFGSSQRLVSIFIRPTGAKQDAAACRVDYTKDGKTETLWVSQSDRAFCTAKAIGLVTKLGEGNYSCKPEAVVKPEESEPSE
jgi:hypothetical protein